MFTPLTELEINVLKGNGQIFHTGVPASGTHRDRGISANPSAVTVWFQHLAPVSKCAPHIVTGGVSLLDGKLHGMQSGGATQPLFSSSGSGEPSTNT